MVSTQGEVLGAAHAAITKPALDFFREDAIDSVHAIARGDVKGAVVDLGLALYKPAKALYKACGSSALPNSLAVIDSLYNSGRIK